MNLIFIILLVPLGLIALIVAIMIWWLATAIVFMFLGYWIKPLLKVAEWMGRPFQW